MVVPLCGESPGYLDRNCTSMITSTAMADSAVARHCEWVPVISARSPEKEI